MVALALDGKPLVESRHFVLKLVTDTRNVDEVSGRDPRFAHQPNGQWKLDVLGQGPVTTQGRTGTQPIQIGLEGRPLADIYLERGSFELLVNGDNWQFYCDTPGTRFRLHRQSARQMTANRNAPLQEVNFAGSVRNLPSSSGTSVSQFPDEAVVVRTSG
jgi:hypothetical protein